MNKDKSKDMPYLIRPIPLFILSSINFITQTFMMYSCFFEENGFSYAWTTSGLAPVFLIMSILTCRSAWNRHKENKVKIAVF